MNVCTDKDTGKMLHAYELQTLTDDEQNSFEQHLLCCDYCHSKVKEFLPYALEMYNNQEFALHAKRQTQETRSGNRPKSIRKNLWPDVPFLLKPAVSYALVGIVAITGLWSIDLFHTEVDVVKTVQSISLAPLRNSGNIEIKSIDGLDALIQFYVPDGKPGITYVITIIDSDQQSIYRNDDFRLQSENRGMFYLNLHPLKTGVYTLNISAFDSTSVLVTYRFTITK